MKKYLIKLTISGAVILAVFLYSAPVATAAEPKAKHKTKEDLMERIDFGNSYILGQSIKSGAAYLLHRKKSDIKSMLDYRKDYRKEILEDFNVEDKP